MHHHSLGHSGLKVAPWALGGNVFGWTVKPADSAAILDAFVGEGFNLIDTADVYSRWVPGNSGGESETIIGQWLAKYPERRKEIFLVSKDHPRKGPEQLLHMVDTRLAALGTPEELASRYRTEELLKRAQMSRSPAFLLRSVTRWGLLSLVGILVFAVSVFGYLIGGGLSILGVLKVISPSTTGLYGQFTASSWGLSFNSGGQPAPGVHELLGWWLLPIGLLLGPVLFFLTFRFDLWSIRKFWRPRAWR